MINKLYTNIKFKRRAHRFEASARGDCYLRYIIDKYINGEKPDDYIEAYEQVITKREKQVRDIAIFKDLYTNSDGTENEFMIHFLAANLAAAFVLMAIKEEEVQKYLNLIKHDNARNFIQMLSHPDKKYKK